MTKPVKLKDRYWMKTLKWYLYKRYLPAAQWHTKYAFDAALRSLGPGDIIIDCGANIGEITTEMAKTGATVHAFEPDPDTFERLLANTSAFKNVVCHNVAVGAESGHVSLYRSPKFDEDPVVYSQRSSLYSDKINISTDLAVTVEQIDLLEFVDKLERPVSLTKIDIEGAEVALLEAIISRGCVDLFGTLFAETHETKIVSLEERTAALRTLVANDHRHRIFLDWH